MKVLGQSHKLGLPSSILGPASKMHSIALYCGRKCLCIHVNKPLKLQLESSQKDMARI